ncbi:hypothetical protein N7462_001665 [Penicillium macrosclerotiorum]|uniref:uncharacterized protein n=1 Tax=Penicillium macrosclerotiorum TaxID=303699 RepID=UPI00254896D1|nr:uncharacterized protein N7462_001665 [Penicillium macrosclerotiorum]KAJ5692242.1 hypothetical protein N7462_001665 [Penicillium macrosclerotiorum]
MRISFTPSSQAEGRGRKPRQKQILPQEDSAYAHHLQSEWASHRSREKFGMVEGDDALFKFALRPRMRSEQGEERMEQFAQALTPKTQPTMMS